jgi:phosphatidyl-myo-inositol dimannoside synthase
MDLLVITWNYPPRRGGIENLLHNLCAGLREQHRVFIITSFARGPHPVVQDTFRAPLAGLIPFAFYALWCGALVLAREPQIRIVFGGSALVTPLVLTLARVFRRRAFVLTHGLDVIYRNVFYQLLCVRWLKLCDHVVANSNYTAAAVKSKAIAQEKIAVIPPGIHANRFAVCTDVVATKSRWNIDDKKIILFVGRLAKRKGVKEFIENSLVEIARKVPEIVFLIVGDNPTASLAHHDNVVGEINEAVSRLCLQNQVRWLGALSDDELIMAYHACDVVVLPGREIDGDIEGFGIVALEAAAAGKPVVATRVGGVPDAVEHGKSGILVDPGDYQALTEAVTAMFNDGAKRFTIGTYARERVNMKFSWNHVVESWAKVFSLFDDRLNHSVNASEV